MQAASHRRGGMSHRMVAARPSEVRIQRNCVPARYSKFNSEPGSELWVAAKILIQPMTTSTR